MQFTRARLVPLVPLIFSVAGCDGSTSGTPTEPVPFALQISAGSQQQGLTGMALEISPTVRVVDRSGRGVPGVPVQFFVTAGGGWISETEPVLTDPSGLARVDWYMGPRTAGDHILAVSSPVGGTGMRAYPQALEPGITYTSRSGLVEYTHGHMPLILSAPHGGSLRPSSIPDRAGAPAGDPGTQALLRTIAGRFQATSGRTPFTVVSLLDRRKMDPDMAILPGAAENPEAELAWREYHALLATARAYVELDHTRGLFMDLQDAGRADGPVDLGYLLTAAELAQPNSTLDSPTWLARTSIRALVTFNHPALTQVLRGGMSLGERFTQAGVEAVPNASVPAPAPEQYLGSTWSLATHGSRDRGLVSAILMRTPAAIHGSAPARSAFAATYVNVVENYFTEFYRASLVGN